MVFKREPFMIESHQVEHRRVQIIDVYLAVNAIVAEVIGCTVRDATLDAAACHPHGKTVMIMFTTISILSGPRRSSEHMLLPTATAGADKIKSCCALLALLPR